MEIYYVIIYCSISLDLRKCKLSDSLLEKKSAAVTLIRARLVDMPSDPKLWYA